MTDQKYIPNIRNPQMIETCYQLLTEGARSEDEISESTGLEESNLEETLGGLLAYDLARKEQFDFHAQDLRFDIDPAVDLRLTMLHNVRQASSDDEWGLQSGLPLTYAYFLKMGIQYFRHSDEALATAIDEYHQEVGYRDEADDEGPARFQTDKFNNWAKHAALLGLIHKARGSEFTVAPDPALIEASIRLAADDQPAGEHAVYVEDYIEWLDENLLVVPFEEQHVPKSLGRVLYSLARDGTIQLVRLGDPPTVSMDYVPRDDDKINRRINAIKVTTDGN